MSDDGTLPPGCSHADIERRFGGVDDDTCCECSEPRLEDSVDGTMCNACAAEHYRGLYRMMRRERNRLLGLIGQTTLPVPNHSALPCGRPPTEQPAVLPAASALASNL